MTRVPESQTKPSEEANRGWLVGWASNKGGKMKKYNYNFIIHLLLNKYGWLPHEIGAWTWEKPDTVEFGQDSILDWLLDTREKHHQRYGAARMLRWHHW